MLEFIKYHKPMFTGLIVAIIINLLIYLVKG